MNSILLCTFAKNKQVDDKIDIIYDKIKIKNNKIFVLKLNKYNSILTYNALISPLENYKDKINNTINIHRKKYTNTLYTINSLNKILLDNYGTIDPSITIDWEKYKNSLILLKNDELYIEETHLWKIIEFR